MGRTKILIDWKKIDSMCQIQCLQEEIASVMGVSLDTIERRCLEEHKVTFAEYFKQKRKGGRASLRRSQWMMAQKNPALAIFLGKNYLGQSDKMEQTTKEALSTETEAQLIERLKSIETNLSTGNLKDNAKIE